LSGQSLPETFSDEEADPRRWVVDPPSQDYTSRLTHSASSGQAPPPLQLSGKRVLVVDRRKKSEISFAQNRPVQ
jgi:hypothetical protein